MVVKDTKYLTFQVTRDTGKTKEIAVINKRSGTRIGIIRWYFNWRQYVFEPDGNTIWNVGCLQDVIDVINQVKAEGDKL